MKRLLPLSLLFLGVLGGARAQTCGTTISSFPYVEYFDGTAPTGWISGGSNSSWVLGKPAKSVINSAASGNKAWVTSLTGNYNSAEQSFVESPCFNLSAIAMPIVEMKIWWKTEFSFDGAVLQSSIDNGLTWQRVGSMGDPDNWYNDNSINAGPGGQAPGTAEGWSGASGGWVLAKHVLTGLGGKPNVKLRIAFGSDVPLTDEGFAFDNFIIYEIPTNDAGVTSVTSPVSPVTPGATQPVSVTVKNSGTANLNSATIGWSVNNVVQPNFVFTPTSPLGTNAVSVPVQIGTFSFPAGNNTLKAWTKTPNGAADGNPTNDTLSITINSCNALSGNYTINKNAAASATNFTSFGAAAQALANCGVSSPVTINVVPNSGPYVEQVALPVIPGTSATNSVIIEGNNNLLTAIPSATNQGVFSFTGADFVKLNNLRITVDPAATVGWGVKLVNASDNDVISNCTITLPMTTNATNISGIVTGATITGAGNNTNNLLIQNNIINGGYYGVLINGSDNVVRTTGNQVIGNQIRDNHGMGIYLNFGNTLSVIEGNDISRPTRTGTTTYYGINISGNTNSTIVSKNRIHNTFDAIASTGGTAAYGIYTVGNGSVGSEIIVKNNLIYNINNSGGLFYGLYNNGGSSIHYYHNTIAIDKPGVTFTTLRGLFLLGTTITNVKLINNNIYMPCSASNKQAIYISGATIGLISNNNNLFVGASGSIGYFNLDCVTLANWKAVNSNAFDQNSVSVDPLFVNTGTGILQPLAPALNNAGQPLPVVTDDVNGITRSTTTPDIGAYEFSPAANDAGLTAIVAPTSPAAPGSQPVTVTLKNFGAATLTSATIGWKVNGVAQPDFQWTGSLQSLQSTVTPILIGNYNFPAGSNSVCAWTKNPNGITDLNKSNDSTCTAVNTCAPLAGSYTINKNSATAGTNFQSFAAVAQRLNSCGVSGPVTIAVVPNSGPYNEQVEILNIPYTSATYTVTFEGSGNTVSATPVGKPGIMVLNGAKFVKLNNFVITLPATASSGWGLQLINGADFNTFSNNTINLPITSPSSDINGIVTGTSIGTLTNNTSNTKFQDNVINGGFHGIFISGTSGGLNADNNRITGNVLRNQFAYGIYVNNANGTLIEANDISRPLRTDAAGLYGIYLSGASKSTIISKNRIHNTHDVAVFTTGALIGIYTSASATLGNENIIKNNAIYNIKNIGGTFNFDGFYNMGAANTWYFYNTIASDPTVTYSIVRGFYYNASVPNIKFINNNLSLPGYGVTKHALYISAATTLISDNNNLYVGSSGNIGFLNGTDYATLTAWKLVNSNAYDQNSVSVDPMFLNPLTGDMKPGSAGVDNKGQVLSAVSDDITGAIRSTSAPDPGAYEFSAPTNDVGIIAVTGPVNTGCGLSATETITVTIKNFGATTQNSIPVSFKVNNNPTGSGTYNAAPIAQNGTATYTFTTPANLSASGAYEIIATTALPGDVSVGNNADTLQVVNSMIPGTPAGFDFETVATGISRFRKVTNTRSAIIEGAGASNGLGSTKGMILDGVDHTSWFSPAGITDPWTNNPNNFAGAYICINPSNFAYPDSLWMTFDLKQLFKTANVNTNFRVTLNGTQVGPTYRPPFSGAPINWQKVKVDLSAFRNASILMIGLESSVKEAYANGTGPANLIDNIQFKHWISVPGGFRDDLLASQIHVFPNPGNGTFNLDLPKGKTYALEVTDLTGKVIMEQKAYEGNNQLNLSGKSKGIYLLKVSGENGFAVRKLIVE